jgi:hypothetical protein
VGAGPAGGGGGRGGPWCARRTRNGRSRAFFPIPCVPRTKQRLIPGSLLRAHRMREGEPGLPAFFLSSCVRRTRADRGCAGPARPGGRHGRGAGGPARPGGRHGRGAGGPARPRGRGAGTAGGPARPGGRHGRGAGTAGGPARPGVRHGRGSGTAGRPEGVRRRLRAWCSSSYTDGRSGPMGVLAPDSLLPEHRTREAVPIWCS